MFKGLVEEVNEERKWMDMSGKVERGKKKEDM